MLQQHLHSPLATALTEVIIDMQKVKQPALMMAFCRNWTNSSLLLSAARLMLHLHLILSLATALTEVIVSPRKLLSSVRLEL